MLQLLNYIIVVLSVILTVLVLLQSKGGGLGSGFGGDGNAYQTKRGLEKGLFIITIILAVIFIVLTITTIFLQS